MGNFGRVAVLALGAFAAKKYMNQQARRTTYSADGTVTTAGPDLLDAHGVPVRTESAGAAASLRSNPGLAWIADPELRNRNLGRLKDLWSQRNER